SISRMFAAVEPRRIWARKALRSINEPSGVVFKKAAARLASNQATLASSTDRTKLRLSSWRTARCCSIFAMMGSLHIAVGPSVAVLVGNVGLGQLGMDVGQAAGWSMVHAAHLLVDHMTCLLRRRQPHYSGFTAIPTRTGTSLSRLFGDHEVSEIGRLIRGAFRPKDEYLAPILSGVWPMFLTGLEMQRSAGLVLLAFVGEVALNHIECLGHAFMQMCRNDRAGLHSDVQHHRP